MNDFKLLLVDDDEVDRIATVRLLAATGLDVNLEQACGIDQALEMLESQSFDCLLVDYHLGADNAFELLERVDQVIDDPPNVILLTGMGSESIAVGALKLGVTDYISKDDLTSSQLRDAVCNALDITVQKREREEEQRTLEHLSLHDSLTGLPNRNLFLDRFSNLLETSKRNLGKFAVLMMDLDHFKQINDNFGHDAGDTVLIEVGTRLLETARDSDTIARMGGDEFTALLPGANSLENATTIAAKLARAITRPIMHEGQDLEHGVSIGISMYPRHGFDANTLLHNADQAMYQAKKSGLDYCIYNPSGEPEANREQLIEGALPSIGTQSELMVCYQPKVSLDDGSLHGAEVLVRWRHPDLGLVQPAEFISAAESIEKIRELTYLIVGKAAAQLNDWRRSGIDLPLAINLSPKMVEDHDLPSRLGQVLQEYSIPNDSIILEITESSLIADPRRARKQLEALVSSGFKISIDDFGTGYSSLQYLRDFPFQEIKIDRTFVRQVTSEWRDGSIIAAILKIAEGFGADCIAEGIETRQTWDHLRQLGCHFGQGFLISKPLVADEFIAWKHLWKKAQEKSDYEFSPVKMHNYK